ncbi:MULTISPECIES: replication initiation factor family protein [Bacillaceae]|uniref:replication initiation factor family protein n=1 Tax=Bacillaceae TaxID=186817 RepID=UPI0011A389E7|nr:MULTISPECIES: replication initiation factor family protein [Bacillaceae]MEC2074003.1 replication initiation factor family protein [Alkalihalophilus marmarensis]TWG74407.1 hypothetical protein L604_000700001020 [Bacillus subtilis J27]
MQVKVSLDKIKLEYLDIPVIFIKLLEDEGEIADIKSIEGFRYHQCLKIQKTSGAYMKLYYQPKNEIWKPVGKLHIETHPNNIEAFSTLLNALEKISKGVYFIATDVAFDIPVPLNNVFVTSNTGRKMNLFNGTRYFGGKGQRGKNGFCRIYDKKQELLKRGLIKDELTRVEIVYKSSGKIELKELVQHPPSFNKYYSGWVINTDIRITPIYKAMIICLQNGDMTINEFSRHYRRVMKKQLNNQETINFDQLIESEWFEQVSKINRFLL